MKIVEGSEGKQGKGVTKVCIENGWLQKLHIKCKSKSWFFSVLQKSFYIIRASKIQNCLTEIDAESATLAKSAAK